MYDFERYHKNDEIVVQDVYVPDDRFEDIDFDDAETIDTQVTWTTRRVLLLLIALFMILAMLMYYVLPILQLTQVSHPVPVGPPTAPPVYM